MALDNAVIDWVDNTEADLQTYKVYYGLYISGDGNVSYTQTYSSGNTVSGIIFDSNFFTASDGLWYFAVSAIDTSNQEGPLTAPVSKRITKVQSKLRHTR